MAIAFVQKANAQAAASATVAFTLASAPTVGNILVAFTDYSQFSVTRTIGSAAGSWTKVFDVTSASSDSAAMWWHAVQAGDGTSWSFPVTGTSSDNTSGELYEISGASTTNPFPSSSYYATALLTATTNNVVTTPSVTPPVLNTFAIGHWNFDNNTMTYSSISSGWTIDGQNDASYHGNYTAHCNALTSDTTTAINTTFTATGSTSSNPGISATVLVAPGTTAPSISGLLLMGAGI